MAKLVTVHGTNAGDVADCGSKWWQLGSAFQLRINEQLDFEKADLEIRPFHWGTGVNSETQRRKAGLRLLKVLRAYDTNGVDYHLLAHSHGGSVVHHALMESAKSTRRLIRLRSWTTVATPFMYFKKNRFLFSRLGPIGQACFIYSLSAMILAILIALTPQLVVSPNSIGISTLNLLFASVMFGAIGTLGYLLLLGFGETGKLRYSDKYRKLCADWYQNAWRGIYHPEDEAISTLRDIHGLRGTIFPTNFLVGAFSILPVIIVPVGLLVLIWWHGGVLLKFDTPLSTFYVLLASVVVLFLVIVNFLFIALIVLAFRGGGYLFGIPLSPAINTSIWSQIKRTAWGGDLVGEYVQSVEPVPNGFDCQPIALPENAVKALSAFTDQHSTETVRKARNILALASHTGESADLIHQISAALSWNELVHTAYFGNEEFIKFVALVLHDAGVAPLRQSD